MKIHIGWTLLALVALLVAAAIDRRRLVKQLEREQGINRNNARLVAIARECPQCSSRVHYINIE